MLRYLSVVFPPLAGVFLHKVSDPGQEKAEEESSQAGHGERQPEEHRGLLGSHRRG